VKQQDCPHTCCYCLYQYWLLLILCQSDDTSNDIYLNASDSIYLSIYLSIDLWLCSSFFYFGHFFSFLILYTDGRTPSTENQPVARPLPTDIHALSGIRTHDPSVREREGSSCLRQRDHCDGYETFYEEKNLWRCCSHSVIVAGYHRYLLRADPFFQNPIKIILACSACYQFHADFFLGLFFEPEDGGDMFLRNVS
jgi:hypothetical protein